MKHYIVYVEGQAKRKLALRFFPQCEGSLMSGHFTWTDSSDRDPSVDTLRKGSKVNYFVDEVLVSKYAQAGMFVKRVSDTFSYSALSSNVEGIVFTRTKSTIIEGTRGDKEYEDTEDYIPELVSICTKKLQFELTPLGLELYTSGQLELLDFPEIIDGKFENITTKYHSSVPAQCIPGQYYPN